MSAPLTTYSILQYITMGWGLQMSSFSFSVYFFPRITSSFFLPPQYGRQKIVCNSCHSLALFLAFALNSVSSAEAKPATNLLAWIKQSLTRWQLYWQKKNLMNTFCSVPSSRLSFSFFLLRSLFCLL